MNQKLIKSLLLGTLSVATLVPAGVSGYKAYAMRSDASVKVKMEVPELKLATPAPTTEPATQAKEEAAETKRIEPSATPTPSPVASESPSPIASPAISSQTHFSIKGVAGDDQGELEHEDRVEVKDVGNELSR